MCICKYVDVVCVRMCADTYHKYLCQHASGRTGHQVSSFNTLHLVFESGSLTELRASHLARLAAPRALPVSAYPPNPWLYGEGHGHVHHMVLTLACHITNWAVYPDQTPRIPNQDEYTSSCPLPLRLKCVFIPSPCQLAGCHHCYGPLEWSVSFRPFCLHPAFCSNSPFAILALPNFLQFLLDLNSSLRLKVHISTGDLLSLKALPKLVPSRMFFFLTSLGKPLMYVIHAQHFVFLYGTSSQSSVRRPPLTKQWASWKYSLYNFPSLRHPFRVQ